MSFRCDFCGEVSPKRTPLHLVQTKTREKVYVSTPHVHTVGVETVEERKMCDPCWRRGEVAS